MSRASRAQSHAAVEVASSAVLASVIEKTAARPAGRERVAYASCSCSPSERRSLPLLKVRSCCICVPLAAAAEQASRDASARRKSPLDACSCAERQCSIGTVPKSREGAPSRGERERPSSHCAIPAAASPRCACNCAEHIAAWARESASSSPAAVASIAAKRSASASVIQTVDRIRKAIRTAICSSAHRSGGSVPPAPHRSVHCACARNAFRSAGTQFDFASSRYLATSASISPAAPSSAARV
mmetsp:Transcript_1936/g.6161  ORF Transcript_1936/g.6161 Transcript_1936/m.6161 type:complete len:243 (-) Transcript_1936:642-1370(-)